MTLTILFFLLLLLFIYLFIFLMFILQLRSIGQLLQHVSKSIVVCVRSRPNMLTKTNNKEDCLFVNQLGAKVLLCY